jgi:hypothetical protein
MKIVEYLISKNIIEQRIGATQFRQSTDSEQAELLKEMVDFWWKDIQNLMDSKGEQLSGNRTWNHNFLEHSFSFFYDFDSFRKGTINEFKLVFDFHDCEYYIEYMVGKDSSHIEWLHLKEGTYNPQYPEDNEIIMECSDKPITIIAEYLELIFSKIREVLKGILGNDMNFVLTRKQKNDFLQIKVDQEYIETQQQKLKLNGIFSEFNTLSTLIDAFDFFVAECAKYERTSFKITILEVGNNCDTRPELYIPAYLHNAVLEKTIDAYLGELTQLTLKLKKNNSWH